MRVASPLFEDGNSRRVFLCGREDVAEVCRLMRVAKEKCTYRCWEVENVYYFS
jgi:hypothetical protein